MLSWLDAALMWLVRAFLISLPRQNRHCLSVSLSLCLSSNAGSHLDPWLSPATLSAFDKIRYLILSLSLIALSRVISRQRKAFNPTLRLQSPDRCLIALGMSVDAASILVSVRVKPPSTRSCVTATPGQEGSLIVEGRNGEAVLDGFASITGGSDQMEAYDAVAGPLVDRVMQGYSCTLMAYGQTGSGKTHTIFGPPGCLTEATLEHSANNDARSAPADWGLFPRVALELLASGKGTLHASAVEVYQERAYDLLADRLPLAVGTQKVGGKVSTAGKDKEGRDEVHKSTCTCRECYLRKEQAAKDRKAGLSVRVTQAKVTDTGQGPPRSAAAAAAAAAAPAPAPAAAPAPAPTYRPLVPGSLTLSPPRPLPRRAKTPGNMKPAAGQITGFATVGTHPYPCPHP